MKNINKLSFLVALTTATSCGTAKKATSASAANSATLPGEQGITTIVAQDKPSDSTGLSGGVSLGFGASLGLFLNNLGLTDSTTATTTASGTPASVLKINDTISLSYAKFRITGIGIHAAKDPSDDEKTHQQELLKAQASTDADLGTKAGYATGTAAGAELVDAGNGNSTDASTTSKNGNGTAVSATGTGNGQGTAAASASGGKSQKDQHAATLAAITSNLDSLRASGKSSEDQENTTDKNIHFAGPFIYNAITSTFDGAAPSIDLPDGSYHRVQFHLHPEFPAQSDETSLSDLLTGNVFAMQGTLTTALYKTVPFQIEWHSALNFMMAGDSAFVVTAGKANALSLVFDTAKWFDGIDLTTATVDADGTIYINKTSNQAIMKQLRHNILTNTHFGNADSAGKLAAAQAAGQGTDLPTDNNPM